MQKDIPGSTENVREMLRQATRSSQTGDVAAARQIVSDILNTHPNNADAWYLLAYLTDDPDKKREAIDRALALNPRHARTLQMLSQIQPNAPPTLAPIAAATPQVSESVQSGTELPVTPTPPEKIVVDQPTPEVPSSPVVEQTPEITVPDQPAPPQLSPAPAIVTVTPTETTPVSAEPKNVPTPETKETIVQVDQTALWAGFVCAAFFGIFGIAPLIRGNRSVALVYFLGGIGWLFVAMMISLITSGNGLCLLLPSHFFLAYYWSRRGAMLTSG